MEELTAHIARRQAPVPEHVSNRVVLQRGVFIGPTPGTAPDLYSRIVGTCRGRDRRSVQLTPGSAVDTDTYFGRFPAAYYLKWTTVRTVVLSAHYHARGRAQVVVWGSDNGGRVRRISHTTVVPGSQTIEVDVDLASFSDGGSVWAAFTAVDDDLTVADVQWSAPVVQPARAPVVAICTFDRPARCLATLEVLGADLQVRESLGAVYVVDQGTDLVRDQDGFYRVATEFGDRLVYIQQPNLGGAGGFTRGMCETLARHDDVHLILMDDDIHPEPETVLRLNAFANVACSPMIVGAQMLYLLRPTRLHVGAEEADLQRLRAGRWSANALHDADMLTERQDSVADAGYTGWWTCLIPTQIIKRNQLPLPMFFQWDDIEFGIRTRLAGDAQTVTLPGAAVWHMDFTAKDHDDWSLYFSVRNSLITAALHSDLAPTKLSVTLLREISRYLVSMQYGLAHTALRGIEDFLAGPDVLADGGRRALEAIRRERADFPETVTHSASEVAAHSVPVRPAGFCPDKRRVDAVLAERAVRQMTGRVHSGRVAIPGADAHWWHVSLFEEAVVPEASGHGVRVRTRDARLARTLTLRMLRVLARFRAKAVGAQQAYRTELPRLTSRDNWQRLFDAAPEGGDSINASPS